MQGAQRWTQSQVSRIKPWAEGGAKPLSHPGIPIQSHFNAAPKAVKFTEKTVEEWLSWARGGGNREFVFNGDSFSFAR